MPLPEPQIVDADVCGTPIICESVDVHAYAEDRWVVSTSVGRHHLVNSETVALVRLLQEVSSWEEAHRKAAQIANVPETRTDFERAVRGVLGGFDLLKDDNTQTPAAKNTYVRFRIPFLPQRVCGTLSRIFPDFLFRPTVFASLFVASIAGAILALTQATQLSMLQQLAVNPSGVALVLMSSMLVHELGHVASCRAGGVQHGEIGFGLYFVLPVVYANITEIWRLPRMQRMISNLSGVYAELLYINLLAGLSLLLSEPTLLVGAAGLVIAAAYQLNPFARRDGYWVLSDALQVPNLMERSKNALQSIWARLFHTVPGDRIGTRSELFLASYSICNAIVTLIFIAFVVVSYGYDVIAYPETLATLVQQAINGNATFADLSGKHLLLFAVYALSIKLVILVAKTVWTRTRDIFTTHDGKEETHKSR